ncbi:uncharacterized protein RAG0_07814 [Rhynchosporium agropyri]|uniref:ABC transporter domain-containing protein n=1 Tax=Rhynchosporium agropyri TaxID=914238 RepID=A0A1E1KN79_9HELO|nr:uncharacterized protein RAG0_07814 [Rhynchosporium agropyri]
MNSKRLISVLKEEPEPSNTSGEQPRTGYTIFSKDIIESIVDIEFKSVAIGSLNPLSFRCKSETTTIVLGIPNGERASFTQLLICISIAQASIISLGGVNIQRYTPDVLRWKVSLIPREYYLLGENIIGSLKFRLQDSESINDNTIKLTYKTVKIHNRIEKLPGGYYTSVDQNFYSLDIDKRRRLMLTRIVLQDPFIVICDKAITTLHKETDEDLKEALKGGFEGRTVLVLKYA